MSEKVQIETHDPEESDRSEEPTNAENNDKESAADNEPEPKSEQEDLEAKLTASQEQAQDYYDRLLRLSAEFDNYKKRTSREMSEVVRYANEKLLKDLLIVVDNLERAISSADQGNPTDSSLLEGINLTLNEVLKILQQYNVEPVKALGESFDPAMHQAVMQQEVEDEPANMVIQEMQKGYRIHDRLLRPAMVVVSKAKDSPASDPTSD